MNILGSSWVQSRLLQFNVTVFNLQRFMQELSRMCKFHSESACKWLSAACKWAFATPSSDPARKKLCAVRAEAWRQNMQCVMQGKPCNLLFLTSLEYLCLCGSSWYCGMVGIWIHLYSTLSRMQTWDLSKNLHDWRFQGKKFTQKTRNFRHLSNRDKKCVNALNWDKTSKKSLF